MLYINGSLMPAPAELTVTLTDVTGPGGRNARGDTLIDRVAVKRALSISWKHLTAAQLRALLLAASDLFFTVSYPDPLDGAQRTITCHAADKRARLFRHAQDGGIWAEARLELEER